MGCAINTASGRAATATYRLLRNTLPSVQLVSRLTLRSCGAGSQDEADSALCRCLTTQSWLSVLHVGSPEGGRRPSLLRQWRAAMQTGTALGPLTSGRPPDMPPLQQLVLWQRGGQLQRLCGRLLLR